MDDQRSSCFAADLCTAKSGAHRGYTILELLVAAAIMFTLVTSLLSAWAASTDFTFMVNESLKRMDAVDRIRSTISGDFNQSAQFVQYDSTVMVAAVDPMTSETVTLYPAILQGGREVRFVRLRTALTSATAPTDESAYHENFIGTNAQALSQFALAPVSPFFIINPNGGQPGYWNLSPVWESDRTGLTFDENADPANLRLYRYILVPYANVVPTSLADSVTYSTSDYPAYPEAGPNLRRGTLLRQYRNANTITWLTLGLPLSDAVVFDTANVESDSALPDFVFSSAYDGVTRVDTETPNDNEVRLKISLGMQVQKVSSAVLLDLRLSFPFRRVDFGE